MRKKILHRFILIFRARLDAKKVTNKKLSQTYTFWVLELRGLTQNQIITLDFISQNDQRKKLYYFSDFENETPTHISATHASSKLKQ